MTDPVVHQGSCLCGAVRYETTAPIGTSSHCYCSMCRKAHGAAFASYGNVRREHHRFVQGQALVGTYRSSADVTRQFCSVCGSPLLWHSAAAHADTVAVPLGTLDTPFDFPPKRRIHVDSRAPWVELCDSRPHTDRP